GVLVGVVVGCACCSGVAAEASPQRSGMRRNTRRRRKACPQAPQCTSVRCESENTDDPRASWPSTLLHARSRTRAPARVLLLARPLSTAWPFGRLRRGLGEVNRGCAARADLVPWPAALVLGFRDPDDRESLCRPRAFLRT